MARRLDPYSMRVVAKSMKIRAKRLRQAADSTSNYFDKTRLNALASQIEAYQIMCGVRGERRPEHKIPLEQQGN